VAKAKTNSMSLDELFAISEKNYSSLFIQVGDVEVELLPALRLEKAKRKELGHISDGTEDTVDEDERLDGVDVYQRLFRLIAAKPEQAEALISLVGERLDVYKTIQDEWAAKTTPGEASPSAS
jgi:hypothetical protein